MAGELFVFSKASPCRPVMAKTSIRRIFEIARLRSHGQFRCLTGPNHLESLRLSCKVCYFQVGEGIRH